MKVPADRMLNPYLSEELGREVLLFESVDVEPGARVTLEFVAVASPWAQGVWLATEGVLAVAGTRAPQVVLWEATAPRTVEIGVERTDGRLRLYNVWDPSGMPAKSRRSQGRTSGMLRRELDGGLVEYRCNDSGPQREFDRLVFTLRIE